MIIPEVRVRFFSRLTFHGILIALLALFALHSTPTALAAGKPADPAPASPAKDKPYALIAGTVWGPDDRPVYGVTVKIRRAKDKKPKWEVYSDHHGEFAQRVPAGESDYILSVDLKHLKPADGQTLHLVQEVTVHIYGDEREDTGLHLSH